MKKLKNFIYAIEPWVDLTIILGAVYYVIIGRPDLGVLMLSVIVVGDWAHRFVERR